MDSISDIILFGIITGSLYALATIGYSLIYSMLGFVNFAHGELLTLGAYAFLFLSPNELGLNAIPNLLMATLFTGVVSVIIGLFLLTRARRQSRMSALVVAIACSIIIQNLLVLFATAEARPFPIWNGAKESFLFGMNVLNFSCIVASITILIFLWYVFLKRTSIGLEILACATEPKAAKIWGLRGKFCFGIVFFISGCLAAFAGIALSMDSQIITPSTGFSFGIHAFIASVIGGLTNLRGAVAGAYLLGVIENLTGYLLITFPTFSFLSGIITKDLTALVLLVLVLLFKPHGLFTSNAEARP